MRRAIKPALLVGLILAISACGGGGGDDDDAAPADEAAPTTRARPAAATEPSGPPGVDPKSLLERLPKASDIKDLQLGIPTVAAIRIMNAEVHPDTTGPCGAALTVPPLDAGAGRTYATVKGSLLGWALPRDAAMDAYVEANRADLTAGCPSHAGTNNDEVEETLSAPEVVDVSATVPEGVAWISTIEGSSPEQRRATVLVPTEDAVAVVTMTSEEPIDAAFVQTMADVWYQKLAG